MTENYYAKFLDMCEVHPNPRDPVMVDWLIKYQHLVLKDYITYSPKKIYKYMLTFTLDPKKVNDITSNDVQKKIESYIVSLFKDSRFIRVYYVKEHAQSNCHWHVVIYMNNCFKQDHIRYYRKKYGNVDVSRSHELSDEHTQKYLSKEPGSKIIQIL